MKLEITIPIPDEFAHIPKERWEWELAGAIADIAQRLERDTPRDTTAPGRGKAAA